MPTTRKTISLKVESARKSSQDGNGLEEMICKIDPYLLRKLEVEAQFEQIPLGTLIENIISDYSEWDLNAVRAGWIVFLRYALKELLDVIDEKTLSQIARRTADRTKFTRITMTSNDNLKGFIAILYQRSKKSGFLVTQSSTRKYIIFKVEHEMGRAWSIFHKFMYERILENVGHKSQIDYTESSLIIKIKR